MTLQDLRKRTKILVIDDDENAFPSQTLRNEGYTIEYWPEVLSLDRLERGDFDIIVLDIAGVARRLAPEEDGFGVLRDLKRRNPAQVVVAFSGQSFDLSKHDFFKLADDVLPKPATPLKCKEVLDDLIEAKMTIRHLWDSLAGILRADGIPERKIRKLEAQLAAEVAGGGSGFHDIVKRFLGPTDLVARIAGIVIKIVTLCAV